MPKFAKRFLIGLSVVLAAAAIALLCINLYLQSGGVQERLKNTVTRALGTEIAIGGTSFTPWSGLVLKNIAVPDPTQTGGNLVEAKALRIRFALMPLLDQRFVITEASLFDPKVVVRQLENGDWMVPLPAKIPPPAKVDGQPAQPATPKVAGGPVFRAEVERLRLRSGIVTFIDAKGQTVLLLDKVEVDAQVARDLTASGDFSVARVELAGLLKPRKVGGPFTWDGQMLDLPQIEGSLAGGKIKGNYRVSILPTPAFTLDANLDGVQLKKLLAEANKEPGKTDGVLQGNLKLSGDPRTSEPTVGAGVFELINAKLTPIDFLAKLGELFQIEELQLLKLKTARLELTIRDEKVWVDDLNLKSENLVLRGKGQIRFNRKMNIDGQLLVNRKLQQQLKGLLGKNFVDSEDPEYKQVSFAVTGKVDSPKTDLLDKIIGIKIGSDVGGMLKGLFRVPAPKKEATPEN